MITSKVGPRRPGEGAGNSWIIFSRSQKAELGVPRQAGPPRPSAQRHQASHLDAVARFPTDGGGVNPQVRAPAAAWGEGIGGGGGRDGVGAALVPSLPLLPTHSQGFEVSVSLVGRS